MTRFVFLTDTHLGAAPVGYCQQPAYPQEAPQLFAALADWMARHGPFDFVLHGGDCLDRAEPVLMDLAVRVLGALPAPVRLCLGNHDLTRPGARADWLARAPGLFPGGDTDFSLRTPDGVLHVAVTHWGPEPHLWHDRQDAHLRPEQMSRLEAALRAEPGHPHVLVTHSPACGLPPAQTGFDAPFHAPPPAFAAQVHGLAARHPALRLVLGGHNHMNLCVAEHAAHLVTASSFVEAPFEFKVVELAAGSPCRVRTHALGRAAGFPFDYDPDRSYVQGRPVDRAVGA